MHKKTKKIDSTREGNIWLNVFETQEGIELFSLTKSYKTKEGWRYSNFFQQDAGDADCIVRVLERWEQSRRADSAKVSIDKENTGAPAIEEETVV